LSSIEKLLKSLIGFFFSINPSPTAFKKSTHDLDVLIRKLCQTKVPNIEESRMMCNSELDQLCKVLDNTDFGIKIRKRFVSEHPENLSLQSSDNFICKLLSHEIMPREELT
jgi:hypothetical protein